MTKQKRTRTRSPYERTAITLAILLFVGAGLYGLWNVFVRPPDVQTQDPVRQEQQEQQEQTPADITSDSDETTAETAPTFTLRKGCYTVLISGLDKNNGGSDTNILVMIDTEKGEINALSLPRDTLINTPWSIKKLNNAYNIGGTPRLQQAVSDLLGIPVNFYLTVDLEAFEALVDAIGGVNFDVPIDMNYDDPVQDLHIHFNKGLQYLNGEDALKVVRFRHNNDGTGYGTEDIGRIETQQKFLIAVAKQMLSSLNPASINAYANLFATHVETDLSVGNLIWIAEQAVAVGMDNIHFYTLPGDGAGLYQGISYYILYPEDVVTLVNDAFNPYNETLTPEDMDILAPAY